MKKAARLEKPELWVEWTALDEVKCWPRNPKRHDVPGIRRSLRQHGVVELAARDERTGRLVAGHGRLEALEAMKADGEPPPARVRVLPGGAWAMPVLRGASFKSEAEAEAYLLASNRLTERGGNDDDLLASMLRGIRDADEALLAVTGYGAVDVRKLLTEAVATTQDKKPSKYPRRAKVGDVWALGRHTLAVSSSTDPANVERILAGRRVATLVTSPPYWTGQEYDDKPGVPGIRAFMGAVVKAWAPHVDRRVQIQTGSTNSTMVGEKQAIMSKVPLDMLWTEAWAAAGWLLRHRRVWQKAGQMVHTNPVSDMVDENWELVLTFYKDNRGGQERTKQKWANAGVWDVSPGSDWGTDHPCPFPVEMASRMVQLYSVKGNLIAEPFSGSGTTLIAAEQLGRDCVAFDLSPRYCDEAIARWESLTGEKAKRTGRA